MKKNLNPNQAMDTIQLDDRTNKFSIKGFNQGHIINNQGVYGIEMASDNDAQNIVSQRMNYSQKSLLLGGLMKPQGQ